MIHRVAHRSNRAWSLASGGEAGIDSRDLRNSGARRAPAASVAVAPPLAVGGPSIAAAVRTASPLGPRVLLADDDAGVRIQLRRLLEQLGIHVVAEAADGLQAVRLAVHLRPDVVLLDLRMPLVDGINAAALLDRLAPASRTIMLSAYNDPTLQRDARRSGVYAYLVKGCSAAVIRDAVLGAWGWHRSDHEPDGAA